MKAIILEKNAPIEDRPLLLHDSPLEEPRLHQLRIKVTCCGICRTDLHIIEGDIPSQKMPIIPGHQVVGRVDEIGANVTKFKVGDRVGVAWLGGSCGQCKFCLKELENLCLNAQFTGFTYDGGYAQYMVANADFIHHLPDNFPDIEAAPLLCAGVIGYRSLKLTQLQKGDKLGLVGFGTSANTVIQVARYLGYNVFVFTKGKEHQKLARLLGAEWVGELTQQPPKKLDAVIIFAPLGETVSLMLSRLERGGKIVINAIHMTPIPGIQYADLWHEKVILSVANGTRIDAKEFLQIASQIPIKITVETFPLDKANEALLKLKQRKIKGAAVLEI